GPGQKRENYGYLWLEIWSSRSLCARRQGLHLLRADVRRHQRIQSSACRNLAGPPDRRPRRGVERDLRHHAVWILKLIAEAQSDYRVIFEKVHAVVDFRLFGLNIGLNRRRGRNILAKRTHARGAAQVERCFGRPLEN